MIVQYTPTNKITIGQATLTFGETREQVRATLAEKYKEDDRLINLGSEVLDSRRDIYKNIQSAENYLFLSYDNNNLLKEVEVHFCDQIQILDLVFSFNDDTDAIAAQLSKHSAKWEKRTGEYFFEDLQMTICNQEQMGGEGNELAYFYCSNDVTHLKTEY